ncbi:hypothetical protein, partial [Ralstonia pseudosolanacearum]|uniref:hypothetical protein n=1 Tax=Ralstonia pseudosolanacearum TaxID=1310165 RepID=UPI001E64E9C3
PAKVENLRSQPGCLQRYLSGPLHVNVSSPRGAAGLCNNARDVAHAKDLGFRNAGEMGRFKPFFSRFGPLLARFARSRRIAPL